MKRSPLGPTLEALLAGTDFAAHEARDPIRFPKRYRDLPDIEVAAAFSACLAFGKVTLFGPVVERVLDQADRAGGPARFAAQLATTEADNNGATGRRLRSADGLEHPLYYRWLAESDLAALLGLFGTIQREEGSLAAIFRPGPAEACLGGAMEAFRGRLPADASRGLRSCFPHPSEGSAVKRWCMFLRWMVRSGAPDLGLWTHLRPANLVIPLDTHVFRVARFLGLTTRATPGWKTAVEITENLRRFDAADPVRYDFALAHLGISGACRGFRDPEVCPGCPLDRVCLAT